MGKKWTRQTGRLIWDKVVASTVIATLTLTNLVLISSFFANGVISYAAGGELETQSTKVNRTSIDFDSYFIEENGNHTHSFISDIDKENTLQISLNLTEGYLKDAVIELRDDKNGTDLNFDINKEKTNSELIQDLDLENKTISLKQINSSQSSKIEVPISIKIGDTMNLKKLDQSNKMILKGTYVDNKGKEIKVQKDITVHLGWQDDKEISLKTEISKYLPVQIGDQRFVLLQTKIQMSQEKEQGQSVLPIKTTNVTAKVPTLNGETPNGVQVMAGNLLATNGKTIKVQGISSKDWNYDENASQITIKLENKEDNGMVYVGSGIDDYYINYLYPITAYQENSMIQNEIIASVERYQAGNTKKVEKTSKENLITNKKGDIVTEDVKTENEALSKGKLYANFQGTEKPYITEFETVQTFNISKHELIDSISTTCTQDHVIGNSNIDMGEIPTYLTKTTIGRDKLVSILGENGKLSIVNKENGNVIDIIDKNTIGNQEGNIVVNYDTKPTEVEFILSKPQQDGILEIKNTKAIPSEIGYSKEQVKNFTKIVSTIQSKLKIAIQETEQTLEKKEIITPLSETTTNPELQINKTSLSTIVENKNVELKIVLNNDKETSDLYTNPSFRIELPSQVEAISIQSSNLLYDNELKIEEVTTTQENGKTTIEIKTSGKQTKFSTGSLSGGTNIVLDTNISLKKLTPTMDETIKFLYNNENANTYQDTEKNIPITFSAPTEMVNISEMVESGNRIDNIDGDKAEKISIYEPEKTASIKNTIINNYPNKCSDVEVMGRIPFKDNKKITTGENLGSTFTTTLKTPITIEGAQNAEVYYTENAEADKDLNKQENGWTKEPQDLTKVKSYLVKTNQEMETSQNINVNYEVAVPANLEHNHSTFTTSTVYYNNNKPEATIPENKEANKLGLTTGAGPQVNLEANVSVGNGTDVNELQRIKYTLKATNTGKDTMEEVVLTDVLPTGTTYTEFQGGSVDTVNDYVTIPEKKQMVWNLGSIKPGETITKEFEVLTNRLESGQTELKLVNQVKLIAKEMEKEAVTTVENTVKDSEFSIKAVSVNPPTSVVGEGEEIGYDLTIENISENTINQVEIKSPIPENTMYKEAYFMVYDSQAKKYNPVYENVSYDEKAKEVIWKKDSMQPGEKVRARLMLTAASLQGENYETQITHVASVQGQNTRVYETGNENDDASKIKTAKAKLVVNKTSPTPKNVREGDTIDYIVTVKNEGQKQAQNVKVTDYLPDGLEAVGTIAYSVGNTTSTETAYPGETPSVSTNIAPGETLTVNMKAKAQELPEGMTERTVSNHSTITSTETGEMQTNAITNIIEGNGTSGNEDNHGNNDTNTKHKISGNVWFDENANGMKDQNEKGIGNITVKLLDSSGAIVKDSAGKELTALTSEDGNYTFYDLNAGNYIVIFNYDTTTYGVTEYKKAGVSEELNSDAIQNKIMENGQEKLVAVSDTIQVEKTSISDINLGLIKASKFDLALDKTVSKITVQNKQGLKTYDIDGKKLAKIDVKAKYLAGTTITIEYQISVTNAGDTPGYAKKLVDYIPQGTTFSSELSKDWYTGKDGNLYSTALENTLINPGETKTVSLILSKKMTGENTGMVNNTAEIAEDYNAQGLKDINSTPNNKAQGENDMSSANCLLTVDTGQGILYFVVILMTLTVGSGAYIIRRHIIKRGKN